MPTTYVLIEDTGNMIASFTTDDAAFEALDAMVQEDPQVADEVALFTYDEQGRLAADPAFVSATGPLAVAHVDSPEAWYGGDEPLKGFETPTSSLATA